MRCLLTAVVLRQVVALGYELGCMVAESVAVGRGFLGQVVGPVMPGIWHLLASHSGCFSE